jgi:peptidoglycan/xylan/chitin deacetylase (PgdA/CDA1 family)
LADLNTPEIMNWDEARKMASDGFQFGSHTLGHVVLTFEGPLQIDREILRSKNLIERELGTKVDHFSYCNGWYSEQIVRTLVRHGFRSAVTTEDLPNRLGANPFTLKRKMLWENFSIGPTGRYSAALTACHLDDVFGTLGLNRPVIGHCTQRITSSSSAEAHASSAGASS